MASKCISHCCHISVELTDIVSRPDVIVSVDACFTQKRRKGKTDARDAPRRHPDSVFLSEQDIRDAEASVQAKRPDRSAPVAQPEEEDFVEEGLRVPKSVLDGCGESFLAADEKREKASTKFFSDTGLMALICRHDRVLWIANMTSAGEHQHYAIALIERLFSHLPDNMSVGLLYDIGCQLHRSCIKWGFLKKYLHRLSFAVSVFHAYGHQWA